MATRPVYGQDGSWLQRGGAWSMRTKLTLGRCAAAWSPLGRTVTGNREGRGRPTWLWRRSIELVSRGFGWINFFTVSDGDFRRLSARTRHQSVDWTSAMVCKTSFEPLRIAESWDETAVAILPEFTPFVFARVCVRVCGEMCISTLVRRMYCWQNSDG